MFFEEELKLSLIFQEEQELAEGVLSYRQRKTKIEVKSNEKQNNVCLAVFDRVKIKVEATKEFPLDIKCSLLVTKKDIQEFEKIRKLMETREELKKEKMAKMKVL